MVEVNNLAINRAKKFLNFPFFREMIPQTVKLVSQLKLVFKKIIYYFCLCIFINSYLRYIIMQLYV